MPAKTLEASVRHQPSAAIIHLHGEINAGAEATLDAAYAEAERHDTDQNDEPPLHLTVSVPFMFGWG